MELQYSNGNVSGSNEMEHKTGDLERFQQQSSRGEAKPESSAYLAKVGEIIMA